MAQAHIRRTQLPHFPILRHNWASQIIPLWIFIACILNAATMKFPGANKLHAPEWTWQAIRVQWQKGIISGFNSTSLEADTGISSSLNSLMMSCFLYWQTQPLFLSGSQMLLQLPWANIGCEQGTLWWRSHIGVFSRVMMSLLGRFCVGKVHQIAQRVPFVSLYLLLLTLHLSVGTYLGIILIENDFLKPKGVSSKCLIRFILYFSPVLLSWVTDLPIWVQLLHSTGIHGFCLHLWRPACLPTPPSVYCLLLWGLFLPMEQLGVCCMLQKSFAVPLLQMFHS